MADDSVAGSGHPLLNPGIVRTVAWLNSYGFGTSDGETHDFECDAPHPYVAIVVQPADLISETVRLVALLEAQGIEIKPIGEAPEGETPDWVEIQSTFDPAGMPGIIYLAHMHDRLLPDELVVVEEQPPPFFAPPWIVFDRKDGSADILPAGRPGDVLEGIPVDLAVLLVAVANEWAPPVQKRAPKCRCECGYKCGGPGRCSLSIGECLKQEGHYVKDCDHKWDGPAIEEEQMSSVTCSTCGAWAINHDMAVGP